MNDNQDDFQIIGANGSIESKERFLDKVNEFVSKIHQGEGMLVQFLNADLVCGRVHLISAIEHAQRAFSRGKAISDTLAMEILLYASGEIQINSALNKMGISDGCENVACIISNEIDMDSLLTFLDLERDDSVLDCSEEKLLRFGMSKESISAAGDDTKADLILERVGMVDVKK